KRGILRSKKTESDKYNTKLEDEVKKQLLELREKDKLLIAQSKLAAVGETLAHIAHQWKQPLSQINSVVANIDADFDNEKLTKQLLEEHLNEIEKLTFYMADTIQSFNNYLQPNQDKEIFSIKDAFEDSFELVYKLFESQEILCDVNIVNDSFVKGVKKEFIQALLVILNNAKDILVERKIKDKKIDVYIYTNTKNTKAIIDIEDNAGGISAKYFDKIFDPYFTTKPHSQGTGHGLCMAKMIVEKSMYGNLNVSNEKDGAKFSIILSLF
ncbi:MAG: HAMP domain-containing sensor histidine kinase, partial [Campylobacterota bacterium]|nr:HAMP domain-containing sensor histidine kinase [Campylobacterota bacterium]